MAIISCRIPPAPYGKFLGIWKIDYIGVDGIDKTYLADSLGIDHYTFYKTEPSSNSGIDQYRFVLLKQIYYFYFAEVNIGEKNRLICSIMNDYSSSTDSISLPLLGIVFGDLNNSNLGTIGYNISEEWEVLELKKRRLIINITYNGKNYENRFVRIKKP